MRQLIPAAPGPGDADLGPGRLAELYAYPGTGVARSRAATGEGRPWLRANMVASADGAATLRGRSGGLSGGADRLVFTILRSLADVIVVGAQTARAEHYRPVQQQEVRPELRAGRTGTPPVAVISRRLDLDTETCLFTAAPPDARTIVITTELAPEERRASAARHADIIVAGTHAVDLAAALSALAGLGHRRVLTEGGPHLLGQFADAELLDELCLTVSPLMAGPDAGRIVASPGLDERPGKGEGVPLELAHVLEDDGFLLCRYIVAARRAPGPAGSA